MAQIRSDIAVVGAGVVGMSAALALCQAGFRVVHVRRAAPDAGSVAAPDPQRFDARVFALSPATQSFFVELGLWSQLDAARIAPVQQMQIFPDTSPGATPVNFRSGESAHQTLAWICEQSNLTDALERSVAGSGVRPITGQVQTFHAAADESDAVLTMSDGQKIRTRLVVAADGAASPLRAMAGIATTVKPYDQQAVVCHLRCERAHGNTAFQWFGPHGVLAFLPLPVWPDLAAAAHQRSDPADAYSSVCSMVWSTDAQRARRLVQADAQELADELTGLTGSITGPCEVLSDRHSFDLQLRKSMSLVGDRLALAGDAAHVVHPLAGQGMNLGLGDAACLAQLLGQARKAWQSGGFDAGHALLLRRYQRHRIEPVLAMQAATDGLQRLFDPQSHAVWGPADGLIRVARDAGWQLVANNAYLRRQLIRYATASFL